MTQASDGPEFTEATAPPMQNGEVVFDEPWQSRVFGMAHFTTPLRAPLFLIKI